MAHTSEHLAVLGNFQRAKKGGGGASNLLEQLKRESRHPESVVCASVCSVTKFFPKFGENFGLIGFFSKF